LYDKTVFGIIMVLVIMSLANISKADLLNPSVYSTDSSPYGIPYQKWLEASWQWKFSVPTAENTANDFSPAKCVIGQRGPVWFFSESLSGTQVRPCTVPAGESIFIPVLDGECDLSDTSQHSDSDLIKCASQGNDYAVISASVDGVPIKNLDSYRTHTEFFNLTVPADNIYHEGPPGSYRAYADATVLFLHPLQPGSHIVHYTVSVQNPDPNLAAKLNYATDAYYKIFVRP
jgi:hypothetical protein